MTTKHSPGPWEVHGDTTQQAFYVHGANVVCDIHRGGSYSPWCDGRFSRTPSEDEANARLIAAAPELLSAIRESQVAMKEVFDWLTSDESYDVDVLANRLADAECVARSAIAEAVGSD